VVKYFLLFVMFTGIVACNDSGLSGDYVPKGPSLIEKFVFHSGGKVDVVSLATVVGSYTFQGTRVEVTMNGQALVFEMEASGCLNGGLAGTFCKA